MKKFFDEFKKFITRGNIVDMAVGVIVGSAFTAIVTALTNSIIKPFINWILAMLTGGGDLSSILTFLKKAYTTDTNGEKVVDLANSIYINWGDFIVKVLDFLIIAFVIFTMVKIINKSREYMQKTAERIEKAYPNRKERKELKKRGVNLRDRKAVQEGLKQMLKEQEDAKKQAEANKPKLEKTEDILKDIRELLKAQASNEKNEQKQETEEA